MIALRFECTTVNSIEIPTCYWLKSFNWFDGKNLPCPGGHMHYTQDLLNSLVICVGKSC